MTCLSLLFVTLPLAGLAGESPPELVGDDSEFPRTSLFRGRVTDPAWGDFPVEGALLYIPALNLHVPCDDEGEFALELELQPPFEVEFSAPDYEPLRIQVRDLGEPLHVELQWQGTSMVSETRADVERQILTVSTTTISPETIRAAPHRNAEQILRQAPGVTVVQHGNEGKGHQFFLRGFDAMHGSDFAITAGGIPMNEASNVHAHGYLDLSLLLPEHITSVQVAQGPFLLDQGAFATAGSANFNLGTPAGDRGFRALYTVGTTNRHRLYAGWASPDPDQDAWVGVEALHDQGFGDNRQSRRVALNARTPLLDRGRSGTLHLTLLGAMADFGLVGPLRQELIDTGEVDFYGSHDPDGQGAAHRGVAALNFARTGNLGRFEAVAYGGYRSLEIDQNFTGYLADPEHGDGHVQAQQGGVFGLNGDALIPLHTIVDLHVGAGFHGDHFEASDRPRDPDSHLEDQLDTQVLQVGWGTWAGVQLRPGINWSVDLGARLDGMSARTRSILSHDEDDEHDEDHDSHDEDDEHDHQVSGGGTRVAVSPRLVVRWEPRTDLQVIAAYGRGVRPPDSRAFAESRTVLASFGEDGRTKRAQGFTFADATELGTRWQALDWLRLQASLFGTWVNRESVFDHISGVSVEMNATRRLGVEGVVTLEPLDWLTIQADTTWVNAVFVESGNPVPFAPTLASALRIEMEPVQGLDVGLRGILLGARSLSHGARGRTYGVIDASVHYRWRSLRVGVEVENLLNTQNAEGEYHFASAWDRNRPGSMIPTFHTSAGPPINAWFTVGYGASSEP